jgi:hypothetical protein
MQYFIGNQQILRILNLTLCRCYLNCRLLPDISFIAGTKNVIFDRPVKFFLSKLCIEINTFNH